MAIESTLNAWAPRVLSISRIVIGLCVLQHGTAKILGFPAHAPFANVTLSSMPGIAGLIELIFGTLFVIGLATRPVAFVLSGLCAVAYFYAHAARSFYPLVNGGELAVVYCFIFLLYIFTGPGPWSVDAASRRA